MRELNTEEKRKLFEVLTCLKVAVTHRVVTPDDILSLIKKKLEEHELRQTQGVRRKEKRRRGPM